VQSPIFELTTSGAILLADAGSTKISWTIVHTDGTKKAFITQGINPAYLDDADILGRMKTDVLPELDEVQITSVRFFGAGVFGIHIERLESIFRWQLKCDDVICRSDMEGAAVALFGKEAGVACILGTGSNSCLCEAGVIIDQIPTLGFVLGDEGSAGWLGKQLLRHYFYRSMPQELSEAFGAIAPNRGELLRIIKEDPYFNRYIASFASFFAHDPTHPFLMGIIEKGFQVFISGHVLPYGEDQLKALTVGFVGTVASTHSLTLDKVLTEMGCKTGLILKAPIDALVDRFLDASTVRK
jgi:hypothetical protein